MQQDNNALLSEQANKIQEVIDALASHFGDEFTDELNYLTIVKAKLEDAAKK